MQTPPRSLLFVPGHQQRMLAKALVCGADAVVFDLEDSVPLEHKDAARLAVVEVLREWPAHDAPTPFVRVNAPRLRWISDDLLVISKFPRVGLVIPKVDFPVELAPFIDLTGSRPLIVTIETPRAVLHAESFAETPGVDGLFLGAEDLAAELSMRRTAEGRELDPFRMQVLTAARAAGVFAWDAIQPEFRNRDVILRDSRVAADMGFDGKFAIHPAQIPIIHEAFRPTPEEIEAARRTITAYRAEPRSDGGAVALDGVMIDRPVAMRAEAVLRRAGLT